MRRFPEPISNLVAAFSRLPGVGPKTALRYVFYLLRQPKSDLSVMAKAIEQLALKIQICSTCFTYTERPVCDICSNPSRNDDVLCVVEESRDISTIEITDQFKGRYHVLGGTINPIDGFMPDVLHIKELVVRIESSPNIREIILALSPTVQGETTILYLTKQLKPFNRRISRLARGLPMGATLEYADEITLGAALSSRKEL